MSGSKTGASSMVTPRLEAPADQDGAARRVEQRHVVHEHVARFGTSASHAVVTVLDQSLVVEDRPLREARRAGRVLDLRRIEWRGVAKPAVVLAGEQRVVVREQDPVPDRGELVAHGLDDLAHGVPPELGDVVDRLRSRLLEHVAQLAWLVGGIDRHQRHAGERAAELEQHPLGDVVGVHGDPSALRMAGSERPGESFGVVQEVRVRPDAADLAVVAELLQRRSIGRRRHRGPQHGPDRRQVTGLDPPAPGSTTPTG